MIWAYGLGTSSLSAKKIFAIDAMGALLTAVILYWVGRHYSAYFGMPGSILLFLSFFGFVLFIYSTLCYIIEMNRVKPFLNLLILSNITYCLITLFSIIAFAQSLTTLGLIYFILEIAIVSILVGYEGRIVKQARG
jgi:hypothetical protein